MTWIALLLPAMVVLVGCADEDDQQAGNGDGEQVSEDVQHARDLWGSVQNWKDWPQPEGFQDWQDGKSPHGDALRYYVNEAALAGLTQDGAVIVKANYPERDPDKLMSLTVMEKREGYDPETGDWFYVKYAPDGEVMATEGGKKMAGLVGKGAQQGCIPCHANAGGNDYLFMND
jgi:hypothetical protein